MFVYCLTRYHPNALTIATWFEKLKPLITVNLNSGSLHVEIPYGGKFGRNSHKPYATDDDRVLRQLAETYALNHPEISLVSSRCGSRAAIENSGWAHAGVAVRNGRNDSLLDYLYLRANTLPLDVYATCCNTDSAERVWATNQKSLLSVLDEAQKAVSGFVLSEADQPIANAVVSHDKSLHRVESQANGEYWLLLPPGSHLISVEASGYFKEARAVNVTEKRRVTKVMFKLRRDESVFGMPRIMFVIISGELKEILRFYIWVLV